LLQCGEQWDLPRNLRRYDRQFLTEPIAIGFEPPCFRKAFLRSLFG
jgi:hypothetical protein